MGTHERQYGEKRTDTTDHYTALMQLIRSPNAWRNSGFRESLPQEVRDRLDALDTKSLQQTLQILWQLLERHEEEISLKALIHSLDKGRGSYAEACLYAAQVMDSELDALATTEMAVNLEVYDRLLLNMKAGA